MKLSHALIGVAVVGGPALSTGAASAMPIGVVPGITSNVEQVRYVCDAYGRCFWRPNYAYGYYGGGPAYYAPRYYAPRPRYYGGYGYYGRRW